MKMDEINSYTYKHEEEDGNTFLDDWKAAKKNLYERECPICEQKSSITFTEAVKMLEVGMFVKTETSLVFNVLCPFHRITTMLMQSWACKQMCNT
jgi:hypothetical protein